MTIKRIKYLLLWLVSLYFPEMTPVCHKPESVKPESQTRELETSHNEE